MIKLSKVNALSMRLLALVLCAFVCVGIIPINILATNGEPNTLTQIIQREPD